MRLNDLLSGPTKSAMQPESEPLRGDRISEAGKAKRLSAFGIRIGLAIHFQSREKKASESFPEIFLSLLPHPSNLVARVRLALVRIPPVKASSHPIYTVVVSRPVPPKTQLHYACDGKFEIRCDWLNSLGPSL